MDNKSSKLKLKVFWFNNFLGLAIDQVANTGQYALTPYYFWPKTEAWEQLKLELDSKLWLTQEEKIEILKIIGDIMNYWLLNRGTKTIEDLKQEFSGTETLVFNN